MSLHFAYFTGRLPAPEKFRIPELELIREGLHRLPDSKRRPRLIGRDWLAALGACILVILSIFPVVIPFSSWKMRKRRCESPTLSPWYRCFLRSHFCASCRPSGVANGPYNGSRPLVGIAITLGG